MSTGEKVGENATKTIHIPSDGIHAFYAGSQKYAGAAGESILEEVVSEKVHWVTHDEGRTSLDPCYDGTWARRSDDNGASWRDVGIRALFDTAKTEEQLMPAGMSLDVRSDTLVRFLRGQKADINCYGYVNQGAYRVYYAVSKDQGHTWSDPVQITDRRPEFDEQRWGPEFDYGVRGGILSGNACLWLEDGSIVAPFAVYERLDGTRPWHFRIICARGYWDQDHTTLSWEFGRHFAVGPDLSTSGCCEPALTCLGSDRLFMTTRCQGGESEGLYSTRFSAVSEDGGSTWSTPEPLHYDDGSEVWTPASISTFYDSTKTGKTYWLGNILDGPVFGQIPRYPLALAEFDPASTCLIRDSVRVIQDRPEGAHEHVRYTNFGWYEDRKSGDLIITLPEQFRYRGYLEIEKPEDFAADCMKYAVELEA